MLHCLHAASCRVQLGQLRTEAAAQGVTDLDAAVAILVLAESSPLATLSVEAQYVQAVLMLRSSNNISRDKAVLTMVLTGNVGIHVHTKGNDEEAKARLSMKVEKLAESLHVPLGTHWDETEPRWASALDEVRRNMTAGYQRQAEDAAFKRMLLQHNNEQEEAHNATSLAKGMAASKVYDCRTITLACARLWCQTALPRLPSRHALLV